MESSPHLLPILALSIGLLIVAFWSIRADLAAARRQESGADAAPPGWYHYPHRADAERWWDGRQWGPFRSASHG